MKRSRVPRIAFDESSSDEPMSELEDYEDIVAVLNDGEFQPLTPLSPPGNLPRNFPSMSVAEVAEAVYGS